MFLEVVYIINFVFDGKSYFIFDNVFLVNV